MDQSLPLKMVMLQGNDQARPECKNQDCLTGPLKTIIIDDPEIMSVFAV